MSALVIATIAITAYILIVLHTFKANAGVMFLAACAGLILLNSIDPTVITTAGAIVPSEGEAYVRLTVVLLSILFAAMMFRKSIQGSHVILHGFVGVVLALVLILILPETTGVSWLIDASRESIWQDVDNFRSLIVAGGFGLSLIAVLTTTRKHPRRKH